MEKNVEEKKEPTGLDLPEKKENTEQINEIKDENKEEKAETTEPEVKKTRGVCSKCIIF